MSDSEVIKIDEDGTLLVPDVPEIPFIEGDGVGPEVWAATRRVLDSAIEKAYSGRRKIQWTEILAGGKSFEKTGEWLPESTLAAIRKHVVAIKGPMATPVGGGIRSLNVAIRKTLDLYACVRPVRYVDAVPSPVKHPERVSITIFRENTEDLYAGIEWESGTPEAKKIAAFMQETLGASVKEGSGIGIKPISESGTKRLVKKAIAYALDQGLSSVTLMHKGNIMKYTEGAFRKWGYEAAEEYFKGKTITEEALYSDYGGNRPEGVIVIKDRIADMVFADVLIKPETFDVIATTNLNGDYISDALAAQVGGLGMAPGANIGESCAVFEATHGTAPDIAGKDIVNPSSLILSGVMLLEHIGWHEAGDIVTKALGKAISSGLVTYDLARLMDSAKSLTCSGFSQKITDLM